jgi:cobalt-zinc-cadmium efflux system membrane fusion protein
VAVPDEAIQTVEGGPAIFVPVANEPNTFAKRAVTIGKPVGGLIPIYAGLVEGERFVIAGTFILKAELGKGSAAHEH